MKCRHYDGRRPSGCKFNNYRHADSAAQAGVEPCPRCGARRRGRTLMARAQMATFTVRASSAERRRLDQLAESLSAATEVCGAYGGRMKLGRGDVVRLAVQVLEPRLGFDPADAPAGQARPDRLRYSSFRRMPLGDQLDALAEELGGATVPPAVIPGQTALGLDIGGVTRRRTRV
ncbi:hypothetical protein LRS13_22030 [Svornostia abyssi]|uniref:Uncharacterized protein n=1 Tax=Svornostia abyssi TaxID=2898438 RepID=A0ABY5PF88_9ACTN|nr:hypothetical protein LRS13_22030 [Parviterribacteraceae bacterium J379]